MLSGMSITSLITAPQFSRRSVSFRLCLAAKSGSAASANAIREEIIRLITVHLVVVFWARAIIECPQAGRNPKPWKPGLGNGLDVGACSVNKTPERRNELPFDYTFPERLKREGKMTIQKNLQRCCEVTSRNAV